MTRVVIGLAASHLLLAVLLLSLNLRSDWRWPVKAGAIGLSLGFLVVGLLALEAMLGWPTATPPPAEFRLHAALVNEPDRATSSPGTIYLWLSPRDAEGVSSEPPRAFALPYSRDLHEQAARAGAARGRPRGRGHRPAPARAERRQPLASGRPVRGAAGRAAGQGCGMTSMAGLLVASAPRRRSLLARALRRSHGIGSPVARYRRACLNWQLNPTPGAWSECLRALLAVLEAHEMRSGGEERSG